ncbi:hypothetical protein DSO57_1013837 [Entomophthora muscae]|uniref:Uncharacterized protein n=2 Tax=Entomophthora muscae TaxID=34485 RepID=A0ACC2SIP8_9FUNG|nr:hypothetical protein DSO57_1013835 [Entomophthora muscae]KAJ9062144.1 hypothetical protein DSO57_1013837 [Entomophthora muscae]
MNLLLLALSLAFQTSAKFLHDHSTVTISKNGHSFSFALDSYICNCKYRSNNRYDFPEMCKNGDVSFSKNGTDVFVHIENKACFFKQQHPKNYKGNKIVTKMEYCYDLTKDFPHFFEESK